MNRRQRTQYGAYNDEPNDVEFKVLILDTNPTALMLLAEPFEAQGFDVCKCMSVETALRYIEREDFDFAVVDQGSSAFEGLHVLRHLVRYNLRTSFVVVSEHQNLRWRDEALALGAVEYLQKPISTMKLKSIIHKYFGSLSKDPCDPTADELQRSER